MRTALDTDPAPTRLADAAPHRLGTTRGPNLGTAGVQLASIPTLSPQRARRRAICGRVGIQSRSVARVLTCDNTKFSTIHSTYYYYYNIQLSALSKEARLSDPRDRNRINS